MGGWSESSCGFFRKHLSFGGQKPAAGGRKIGIWWMENRSDAVPRERFSRQMTTRNGIDVVAARVSDIVDFFLGGVGWGGGCPMSSCGRDLIIG